MLVKHRPAGPLARHVYSMWYRPAVPGEASGVLLLPSGRADLVISLDGSAQQHWSRFDAVPSGYRRQGPATLHLLRTGPFVAATSARAEVMGVSFRACGLRAFCRDAPGDHGEADLALEDLWGSAASSWIERLAACPTAAGKFSLLEHLLWQQIRAPEAADAGRIEQAAAWLANPFTVRSVACVAEAVGMTPRKFTQVFREDVGLTPKAFARVMRFSAAAHWVRHDGRARWTEVANLCNYFDQAHMVRDFRDLAGMTPSTYLQHRGGHATCLPWALEPATAPRPSAFQHAAQGILGGHTRVPAHGGIGASAQAARQRAAGGMSGHYLTVAR